MSVEGSCPRSTLQNTHPVDPLLICLEDERTLAFLNIAPATDGHTLVVPKRHTADLFSASAEDLAEVIRTTQSVARLLDDRLRPDGQSISQSNRDAGWPDVPPPRRPALGRRFSGFLGSKPASSERTEEIAARLVIAATPN